MGLSILCAFQKLVVSNFRSLRFLHIFGDAATLDHRSPTQLLKCFEYLKKLFPMFLLIIIFLSIRIAWLFLMPFELFGDEAQYWFWSQNLDFGYYSKPPIVAWAIKATTLFCGNQEACIRLSSPIFHALTAIITYLIGIQLFNYRVGLFSAIVYLTLPAVSLSANIISTDPFLLFFWSLSIYMTLKAIENDKWLSWIIAGISCGLGMMSKYSMVLFLLCLLLFLFGLLHTLGRLLYLDQMIIKIAMYR